MFNISQKSKLSSENNAVVAYYVEMNNFSAGKDDICECIKDKLVQYVR